jgi:hypothetical protein
MVNDLATTKWMFYVLPKSEEGFDLVLSTSMCSILIHIFRS